MAASSDQTIAPRESDTDDTKDKVAKRKRDDDDGDDEPHSLLTYPKKLLLAWTARERAVRMEAKRSALRTMLSGYITASNLAAFTGGFSMYVGDKEESETQLLELVAKDMFPDSDVKIEAKRLNVKWCASP